MQDKPEDVNELKEEIILAKKLGFKFMRVLIQNTDINVFEQCIPYAEENDIWLGVELHSPFSINGSQMNKFLELIEKTHTDHFGFIPDTGIFQAHPNIVQRDRRIRDGVLTKDIALYIEQAWLEKLPQHKVEEKVQKMKPKPADVTYFSTVYNIKPNDPRALIPHMSKIKHVHAKFYGMTEDCQEPTQDSENIISALKNGGFTGYICSEYEGQRHVMDVSEPIGREQVRRHHVMLRRLIG